MYSGRNTVILLRRYAPRPQSEIDFLLKKFLKSRMVHPVASTPALVLLLAQKLPPDLDDFLNRGHIKLRPPGHFVQCGGYVIVGWLA